MSGGLAKRRPNNKIGAYPIGGPMSWRVLENKLRSMGMVASKDGQKTIAGGWRDIEVLDSVTKESRGRRRVKWSLLRGWMIKKEGEQ